LWTDVPGLPMLKLSADCLPVALGRQNGEPGLALLHAGRLAHVLNDQRDLALLFRTLATLRTDAALFKSVDELRWQGPAADFAKFAEAIGAPELVQRADRALARIAARV